jgi:hypothetical protein
MPFDTLTWAAGGLAVALAAYAVAQLRSSKDRSGDDGKLRQEEQTLAAVARLWTGNETELDFRDIARIWRTTPEARAEPKPSPTYRHSEIQQFHARWVAHPVVKEEKREIIEGILAILDGEGDCPSVVQKNNSEAEKKYEKNVFDRLATIPLWRHSLDVATHLAGAMTQAMLIPDALIAGLGHDLGKIPAHQESLYRTGDHPIVSIIVLNNIPGYESMSNRDEVSLSIRQHHLLNAESALGRALKEADHQVRLMEISRLTPELSAPERKPEESAPPSPKSTSKKRRQPELKAKDKQPSAENPTTVPLLPNKKAEEKKDGRDCGDLDIGPPDLNLDRLLEGLKGKINKLGKNRWSVISVPEGWVLAQPDALWGEAKRLAGNAPAFLAADADEQKKRQMLHMIVQRLTDEKQAIATELLGEGYYTTQCLVATDSGRSMKVPLIPFRAEAFGAVPSALELLKFKDLNRMIKKVKVGSAQRKAGDE